MSLRPGALLSVFFSVIVWVLSNGSLLGSPIQVGRVAFESAGRDGWLRCRVQLITTGNPAPEARDRRFLDDVQVALYLSYSDRQKGFCFFQAEVEVVSMEQGRNYLLDFFLPPEVVKRDRLGMQPFAYLLEFTAMGFKVPFANAHGSSNMSNEAARGALVSKAREEDRRSSGVLIPSFLAPGFLTLEDEASYPPFRRNNRSY
jgi:hypothetical protein